MQRIQNTDGHTVAIPAMNDGVSALECSANARLIAKAPAMHDVLRRVADFWAGGDVPAELDRDIRALLEECRDEYAEAAGY